MASLLRSVPPTYSLPPIPPSKEPASALRSRFSAETLVIKPSASHALKSLFSHAAAAASSSARGTPADGAVLTATSLIAKSTRRYHRRVSATQAAKTAARHPEPEPAARPPRPAGHVPSASASREGLDSDPYVLILPTRPSTDSEQQDHRVPPPAVGRRSSSSRSRSRTRPSLRGRTSSNGTGTTASAGSVVLAAAADKLAGAAKDVFDKLTHGRQHTLDENQPSAPRRRWSGSAGPCAPRRVASSDGCTSVDPVSDTRPQPRAESRRDPRVREITADSVSTGMSITSSSHNGSGSSNGARRHRLPELAATRPRPKRLPAHPRPLFASPAASVPPLRPRRAITPTTRDVVDERFSAHAVRVPSRDVIRASSRRELFVRIDVGGQTMHTTTVATLFEAGNRGGKLGEFVEALLADSTASSTGEESRSSSGSGLAADSVQDSELSAPTERSSFRPLLPLPQSPFPFADDLCGILELDDPGAGPIDPDTELTVPIPAAGAVARDDLFLAFPSVFDVPSPTTPKLAPSQPGKRALLVSTPTAPSGFKHKSIHPDWGEVQVSAGEAANVCAAPGRSLPPPPPPSLDSRRSSSTSSDSDPLSSPPSSEAESLLEAAFGGETDDSQYFEVMRDQLHRCADGQDRLTATGQSTTHVRHSLVYTQSLKEVSVPSVVSC